MSARAIFVIPGDLAAISGGYAYDRAVIAEAAALGAELAPLSLPGGWPHPTTADLDEAARRIAATAPDATLLVDGLALGAMPPDFVRGLNRRIVALVHHPLGLEAGLAPARAAELIANERAVLALVDRIVVTSRHTAALLSTDFDAPFERIHVAEPGTAPAPRAQGGAGAPLRLLAVGSILPRKGYMPLVEALAGLRDLDWRLDVAGGFSDRDLLTALRARLDALCLTDRVALLGAVAGERLESLYAQADLFVMPSLYEGYGMALAEAMARGLPIVATRAGAAADTAPDEAALKVDPGDAPALAGALRRVMMEHDLRARLAEASWRAGRTLPRWRDTARRVIEAIEA
ncbi:MAG: glycosyltransferase family 4 protein [Methylobacteriaceae bacterium]|nr:glycosyltransferase family 4 protein [Methylobacteriaceae bacterium]